MYPESMPQPKYDRERVESYMQKAKHLLEDPEKGNLRKLDFLEARKKLWEHCEELGEDPRDYAMYHIMLGTPETLAERELGGGILHEDLPEPDSVANFIDSYQE